MSVSPRSIVDVSALFGSKHCQRNARRVLVRERLGVRRPQAGIGDAVARRRNELPRGDHRVQRAGVFGVRLRVRISSSMLSFAASSAPPLTGGDAREKRVAAVRARDRHRAPLRSSAPSRSASSRLPLRVQIGDHPLRDLASVERVGAAGGDLLERPREIGILQRVAGVERLIVAKEQRARIRRTSEIAHARSRASSRDLRSPT